GSLPVDDGKPSLGVSKRPLGKLGFARRTDERSSQHPGHEDVRPSASHSAYFRPLRGPICDQKPPARLEVPTLSSRSFKGAKAKQLQAAARTRGRRFRAPGSPV